MKCGRSKETMPYKKPGVIVLGPEWHSCGTHQVHKAQISAYQSLNYEVYFLAVCPYYTLVGEARGYWKTYLASTTDISAPFRGEAKLPPSTLLSPIILLDRLKNLSRTPMYARSVVAKYSVLPNSLRDFCSSHYVALIHCNHYFNLSLAKQILPSACGAKIVCETHDIQSRHMIKSNSWGLTRKSGRSFEDYLADEVACASEADEFVHLNEDEFSVLNNALPNKKHYLIFPSVQRPTAPPPEIQDVDFLIVSSANTPNFNSLKWFLQNVWDTELQQTAKLRIVGNIVNDFKADYPQLLTQYGSCFVGRVKDISEWYGRSKAVLAPVIEGEGISIKMVEAISYGKPVFFSPQALRGMNKEMKDFFVEGQCDTAAEFKECLKSTVRRVQIAAKRQPKSKSLEAYEKFFSPEIYRARIAELLI